MCVYHKISIIDATYRLGEHRSRTSAFLAKLPPSGVAYDTMHTLGIVIRVAGKPVGILLTVLLGLNPAHLSSHRTSLVRTSSTEQAPRHLRLVACTFRYSRSPGISPTLNWPEQAPSTKSRGLTGSHHHNACHVSIMSIISQEPEPGLSMHHVHPSKIILSLHAI